MALLKEVEKAKQAKLHMEYLLQKQQIKSNQRWAERNVEEKAVMRQIFNSLENKTHQIEQYDYSGKDTEQEIQEEEKGEQLYDNQDDVTANEDVSAITPMALRQGQTGGQETNEGDEDDEPVIEKPVSAAVSEDLMSNPQSNPQSYKTTKEKFDALGRWS